MEAKTIQALVATLVAAHPRAVINETTVRVYVEALADLDLATTALVVRRLVNESPFFPTIAEIRNAVSEATVAAPPAERAWEEAARLMAYTAPTVTCPDCNYDGCPRCNGTGEIRDASGRPAIHALAARALDSLGGRSSYHASDNPSIFRAQYLKTYEAMRVDAIRAENRSAESLLLARGERRGIEAA